MSETTADVIGSMVVENTGIHFLDSGGEAGRAWQRNRVNHPKDRPSCTLEFREYDGKAEVNVTHNIYHYLTEKVEFDADMDRRFNEYVETECGENEHWLSCMRGFADHLEETEGAAGIYGDGKPFVEYTYNVQNLLSQDIQYLYFTLGERGNREEYALIQVHNGADARGGLTKPRAFRLTDELSLIDYSRGGISCENDHEHYWTTDDAYHWYEGGSTGGDNLESFPAKEIESAEEWTEGTLCILPDRSGLCPHCGGKLSAGFF